MPGGRRGNGLRHPQGNRLGRCRAAEIQRALLALLAGEAFLARRCWAEIWWGSMHLDLASGWQLQIAIERDQLGALHWALAPDGRDWHHGCERNDWTLGPDSRIVEPVALLEPEQRQQLEQRLREASCWPPPQWCGDLVVSIACAASSRPHRPRRHGAVASRRRKA